jgi:hypothetical protein
LSSGVGGAALAQAPEPSAFELGEKAKRAQEAGRVEEAIEGYAKAYQVSGEAVYLYNLADAHRQAGHLDDALRMYQTYVRRDPNSANRPTADKQISELEKQIAQAKRANAKGAAPVGALFPPPPAAGASGAAPLPSSSGSSPPPARIVTPPPVATPPAPPPPAMVPTAPPPVPAPGAELTVAGGPTAAQSDGPPLPRWVPWVLTTATVGLGVAAIVSGVSASSRYDELRDSCGKVAGGCPSADIDDVKSRARRANILWVLTSVAAVGAGVTIYVNVDAAGASGLWRF